MLCITIFMGNFLQQKKKCIIKNYTYNSFNEFNFSLFAINFIYLICNSASIHILLHQIKCRNLMGFCSTVMTILNGIGNSPGRKEHFQKPYCDRCRISRLWFLDLFSILSERVHQCVCFHPALWSSLCSLEWRAYGQTQKKTPKSRSADREIWRSDF